MISETDTVLEEMTLYSTTVSLIGGDKPNVLNRGANDSDVESTITLLRRVAEAKSLIAWLREAIKAKERLLQELTDETLEEYAKEAGIKLNEQLIRGCKNITLLYLFSFPVVCTRLYILTL